MPVPPPILDRLYPFLAITAAIVTAFLLPSLACSYCKAPLHPEITIWWGVIPGIFLIEGLTLPRNAMLALFGRAKMREHLFIQAFNFGLMPVVVAGVHRWLNSMGWLQKGLEEGLLTFVAVPTTTSMCVMHTSVAGGNAPLAAFGAVLGNTLAIVVSPFWLSFFFNLGSGGPNSTSINYSALLISFTGKMLIPLLVGQLLQPSVPVQWQWGIIKTNQTLIGLLILQVFSDVFYHGAMLPASLVLQTVILACVLHVIFLCMAWTLAGCVGISHLPDRIACLFCSTHKTVVLGLPLLRTIFGGSRTPDQMVLLVFPLIAYHLFQLVFDLVLAQKKLKHCGSVPEEAKSAVEVRPSTAAATAPLLQN